MPPSKSIERVVSLPWEHLRGIQALLSPSISAVLHGALAAKELSTLLRKNRDWTSAQRQIAAEAVFGVALWRRRLASLLRDDWQTPTRAPDEYIRALLSGDAPTQDRQDLATLYSLPDWIAQSFAREMGDEAASLADALNLPGPVFVRVNQIKQTIEGLQRNLREEGIEAEPCQYATGGLRLTTAQPNIYGSKSYQRGEFEVQDEGSQLLALLLEARPGEAILDYCAGAGGKTLAFASHTKNEGKIFAFDINEERLSRLRLRAANAGARGITVCRQQDLHMADAVFVDAPCSELGALRRGPDMRFRVKESVDWPEDQYNILQHASQSVRPGGRLVYATCTLRRQENQGVVERFLDENRNFHLRALPVYSAFYQEGFFTSLPHRHGTDGFFAATLERLL